MVASRKPRRPHPPIKMPWWLYYPLMIGTALGTAHLFRQGDPVAAISVVLVSLSALVGFKTGLASIVATLAGILVAIEFAPALGIRWEWVMADQMETSGLTNRLLSIALVGIVISLAVGSLLTIISGRVLRRRKRLAFWNCVLGLVFGTLEPVVLILFFLGGMLTFDTGQAGRWNQMITTVAAHTRQSSLGPIIEKYNPFEHLEELRVVEDARQSALFLREPDNVQALLDDPRITELQEDPEFAATLTEIRSDEKVQAFIKDGGVDGELALHLMNHPAVLRLLDQEGFRELATEIIREASQ